MSYSKVNVLKPSGMPGVGGNMKALISVIDLDDIYHAGLARDSKGIVIAGPIVFKSGRYAIQIEATQSTIKTGEEVTGEDDAEGINQSVEFSHPGDSVAIREFLYNWIGKNCIVVIEKCGDGTKKLFGSPCAPLKLTYKGEVDKAKNGQAITFKSAQVGPAIANFTGTLTYDGVNATVAADSTTISVALGNGEYQLTDGTSSAAAITNLTDAVNGGIYTLLGSGGSHPSTISAGGNFILASGAAWTALDGASITFEAYKDGSSTFSFIEVNRA